MRTADKPNAIALDPVPVPVQVPAPGTGTTSTPSHGTNMGRRAAKKPTTKRTGATAAPPRSPRRKAGVDSNERQWRVPNTSWTVVSVN